MQIIILHRPFLGRAFADPAYQKSRDTCILNARRILQFLRDCPLEEFRKTWTNLTHSVAAAVILILEISHTQSTSTHPDEPLQLVLSAIEIFRSLSRQSSIAEKGVRVLEQLLRDSADKRPGHLKRKAGDGRTDVELERAIKQLRRKSNLASSSASPPAAQGASSEVGQPRHTPQPHQTQPAVVGFGPPPPHALSYASPSQQLAFAQMASPHPNGQQAFYPAPPSAYLPSHSHLGPFGNSGLQQQGGSGTWSPHPYQYAPQGGQGGGGGPGGFDHLFEGLNEFELSGLLEYEQATAQTGGMM